MKQMNNIHCIIIIILITYIQSSSDTSNYLKIDIIESTNLHCKNNNEFFCNPYAIVQLKRNGDKISTSTIKCTKHPQWMSSFTFHPSLCKDIIYINFFQYFTQRDKEYFGASPENMNFIKGFLNTGYLGRVVIELDRLPQGTIDDWFMLDVPSSHRNIEFPSCVHLRISYINSQCKEIKERLYQLNTNSKEDFIPDRFIPLCRNDFVNIYKKRFSKIDSENGLMEADEINEIDPCLMDPNGDYAFKHESKLTTIEEALVTKIIKMTTGQKINFQTFVNKNKKNNNKESYNKYIKEYCDGNKEGLTIERINHILRNHAMKMISYSTNPYVSGDISKMSYNDKYTQKIKDEIYNRTLKQFESMEEIKQLDRMDDDSYIKSINKITEVIRDIKFENKTQNTLFVEDNKVLLTSEGLIDPKEEIFFRIFALYKWNGGHLYYDELKKEFLLRRKYFHCYEDVKIMPSNIIFQFIDDKCPDNYVCLDPNGIVINSQGNDPRIVFKNEIYLNGINLYNHTFNNYNNNSNKTISTNITYDNSDNTNIYNDNDIDLMVFTKLINDEVNYQIKDINNKQNKGLDKYTFMNKFDILYNQRQLRIKKKKEIIINLIHSNYPLIGEILAIATTNSLSTLSSSSFIKQETSLLMKYIEIINNNDEIYLSYASKILYNILSCRNKKHNLSFLLNELIEGLCVGDSRSIKIFIEIIKTFIIDTLLKHEYFDYNDIQGKITLLKILNESFCFSPIVKIQFIEDMLIINTIKKMLIDIIWDNDTTIKIAKKINDIDINQSIGNNTPIMMFKKINDVQKEILKKRYILLMNKYNLKLEKIN